MDKPYLIERCEVGAWVATGGRLPEGFYAAGDLLGSPFRVWSREVLDMPVYAPARLPKGQTRTLRGADRIELDGWVYNGALIGAAQHAHGPLRWDVSGPMSLATESGHVASSVLLRGWKKDEIVAIVAPMRVP